MKTRTAPFRDKEACPTRPTVTKRYDIFKGDEAEGETSGDTTRTERRRLVQPHKARRCTAAFIATQIDDSGGTN
jgi:hypothetical protein